jgi:hypothetical protein
LDLAQILRELSRRKGWLVVGAIAAVVFGILTAYRPTGFPPTLEKRSLELGVASTQAIIDVPDSSLVNTERSLEDVTTRAPVFAEVASTETLTRPIARRAHIPWSQLGSAATGGGEPGAEQRGVQIQDEARGYTLLVKAGPGSPILSIYAQGPTAGGATRLANATAVELQRYIRKLKAKGGSDSLELRQLGAARGSVVNPGVNKPIAVLAGLAAFIAACLLILFGSSVADSYRRIRRGGIASAAAAPGQGVGSVGRDGRYVAEPAEAETDLVASIRSGRRR